MHIQLLYLASFISLAIFYRVHLHMQQNAKRQIASMKQRTLQRGRTRGLIYRGKEHVSAINAMLHRNAKENVPRAVEEALSLTIGAKGSCHRGEFIVAVGGTRRTPGIPRLRPPSPSLSSLPSRGRESENTALRFPPRGGI